jgi:hypothetical protein
MIRKPCLVHSTAILAPAAAAPAPADTMSHDGKAAPLPVRGRWGLFAFRPSFTVENVKHDPGIIGWEGFAGPSLCPTKSADIFFWSTNIFVAPNLESGAHRTTPSDFTDWGARPGLVHPSPSYEGPAQVRPIHPFYRKSTFPSTCHVLTCSSKQF